MRTPIALRRRWFALASIDAAQLTFGIILMGSIEGQEWAARWAVGVALGLLLQVWLVGTHLAKNHRPEDAEVLSTFGPGTALTLVRGQLLSLLLGFVLLPQPLGWLGWVPAILYTAADLTDYFDGYLARISHHATRLGEALDLQYDSLGLLIAVTLAIRWSHLSVWFLAFGFARFAFAFGSWVRIRTGRALRPLPESVSRRPIAGLSMGFVSAMLWPIMTPAVGNLAGGLFVLPFAASFGRDWLVVSGVIDPDTFSYQRLRRQAKEVCLRWLPLGLRVVTAALLIPAAIGWIDPAAAMGAWPMALRLGMAILQAAAGVLVIIGVAGRAAALIFLLPLGLLSIGAGPSPILNTSLLCVSSVLILGTGAGSLWRPEERIFSRRAGESG